MKRILDSKILFTILILKVLVIVFYQIRYSSDFPVTNFLDNDGSNTINVVMRTNLWSSNDWYAYGPLYYRVIYLFNIFSNVFTQPDLTTRQEYLYFSSVFVSLLSCLIFFYCLLIPYIKKTTPLIILNLSLILFHLMVLKNSQVFVEYLLRPHPDYIQALNTFLSGYFILKYFDEEKTSSFFASALFAGLAMSTKLSSVYYCFAWFFSFLITEKFSRRSLKLIISGTALAVGIYFLVGFPQSFHIKQTLYFLKNQTRFQMSPDRTSMFNWVRLLLINICWFLPLLLTLPLNKPSSIKGLRFILITSFIFFISFLITMNPVMGADHYIFPFFFIIMLALIRLKATYISWNSNFVSFLAVIFILVSSQSNFFSELIKTKDLCRGDVTRTLEKFQELKGNYDEAIVDAYSPFLAPSTLRHTWGLKVEDFKQGRTIFSISWGFADSFFRDPNGFAQKTNPEWEKHEKFYSALKSKEFVMIEGINLKKLNSTSCGLEIWEAIKP